MKQLFRISLLLLALLLPATTSAYGYDFEVDGIYYNINSDTIFNIADVTAIIDLLLEKS